MKGCTLDHLHCHLTWITWCETFSAYPEILQIWIRFQSEPPTNRLKGNAALSEASFNFDDQHLAEMELWMFLLHPFLIRRLSHCKTLSHMEWLHIWCFSVSSAVVFLEPTTSLTRDWKIKLMPKSKWQISVWPYFRQGWKPLSTSSESRIESMWHNMIGTNKRSNQGKKGQKQTYLDQL